ncbi:hypothetical protein [Paucibacter soli]|uniref:hypothetical protein n=1 Tax=Paucibacter soli TaxID=3133433 RepID=UPI003095888A
MSGNARNARLEPIASKVAEALPGKHRYESGYRDALESMALALADSPPGVLEAAIETALDAYGNNAG